MKVPPGTLPWYFQNYALLEELARRARSAGGAGFTTTMLPLGNTEPWTVTLEPVGRDSMTILLGSIDTAEAAQRYADVVIEPAVAGVGLLEWDRIDDMIDAGRAAAERALEKAPAGLLR